MKSFAWGRFQRGFALAIAATAWVGPGAHADDKAACGSAYGKAQDLKDKGQLLAAREQLKLCAKSTCKDFIVKDCLAWLEEVDRRQPSIVLDAATSRGEPVDVVRVVDGNGKQVADGLTGRSIQVDPGKVDLTFEARDGRTSRTSVVVLEGKKDQVVKAIFVVPDAPKPATEGPPKLPATVTLVTEGTTPIGTPPAPHAMKDDDSHGSSGRTWGLILGIGGVAVGGVGTLLALKGSSNFQHPGDNFGICDSTCQGNQSSAHSMVQLGWGLVGVGALTIGGGVLLWATSPASGDGARDSKAATHASLDLGPAGLRFRGSF